VSTDTLSEVLRAVRLTGAVFFRIEGGAPWVAEAPAAALVAPHVLPGSEHVIEYHVVTRGSCFGAIVGGAPVRLSAGDVVVFPQGDAHVLSSAPGMRGRTDMEMFSHPHGEFPLALSLGEGSTETTEVVCGFLGCDARPFNPLLATLPRMIHVEREPAGDGLLAQLVGLAVAESAARRSGSECMLARLSELLFVEVMRRYVGALPPETTGWLAGLRDPLVGRALGVLHHRPSAAWSLEDLAKEVGLSRSMLAERFHHFVGTPPMQYLARWRMQLAANLLASTTWTLTEIADRVGYGSEAALSRAFKRWVGVAPSAFREGARAPATFVPVESLEATAAD
jgi:AraC-like DNA-binding protein